MGSVQVRYIVDDVDAAIPFYVDQLGFRLVMHPAPPFAMLERGDLWRAVRCFIVLLLAFGLASCSTTPRAGAHSVQTPAMEADVDYLLTSAASDFHAHQPQALRVRNVRSGYITAADGMRHYRMCGEFLPAQPVANQEWAWFVTIRTSGYEQYLGGQAAGFCSDKTITWDKTDWSAVLQSRLHSAQ